jgi:hypothetical protein
VANIECTEASKPLFEAEKVAFNEALAGFQLATLPFLVCTRAALGKQLEESGRVANMAGKTAYHWLRTPATRFRSVENREPRRANENVQLNTKGNA